MTVDVSPWLALYPTVVAADLLAHLASRGGVHVDDVALAYACCQRDPAALGRFDVEIVPRMRRALGRVRLADDKRKEIVQATLERLLVGVDGGAPRLLAFEGRATLASWTCTVVTRAAIDETRRTSREDPYDDGVEIAPPPELRPMSDAWKVAFKVALQEAMTALSYEERAMLRMHFVEGKSLDVIARSFDAHPTTVSRHLASLRRDLAARTRDGVTQRLGLSTSDLDSVERACASGIDLSMSRVLAPDDPVAMLRSEPAR